MKEGNRSMVIAPGQQVTSAQGVLNKNAAVNLDQVMAWKNGYFILQQSELAAVFRQVSRWYDVDVEYIGVYHNGR